MEDRDSSPVLSRLILAILTVPLLACHDSSPTSLSNTVRAGVWGGVQVSLTVSDRGGVWQQQCADGTIDQPIAVDASGRFEVAGTLRQYHGFVDHDPHPARYLGTTDGKTEIMITVVRTEDNSSFGPYTLTYGQPSGLLVGGCP